MPKRLKALAEAVRDFSETLPVDAERTLADIGCDHALLPIRLLRDGVITYAVASDANEGPLARARENAETAGLSGRMRFVCADGLSGLRPGEVRMAVIAGMGGETIRDILNPEETRRTGITDYFLSPHTKAEVLREYLFAQGFEMRSERMTEDRGKRYLLWHVRRETGGKRHEMQ